METCNDRKNYCGDKMSSICTIYEGELPNWSELNEEICVTIEETIEELYNEVSEIKENLDTSNLGGACLQYPNNENIKQKDANFAFEKNICDLLEIVKDNTNSVLACELNYEGLVEECDDIPKNFCHFAQFILDELKKLKNAQKTKKLS